MNQLSVTKIKSLMDKGQMRQSDLARASGLARQTISRIMKSETKSLLIPSLMKLSKGLHCSIEDILE